MHYKVLWVDDEYEIMENLISRAKLKGIELTPAKSLEVAKKEISSNYKYYGAILLDARFFENENDEYGDEKRNHIFRLKEFILSFPHKKFEYFVLTGHRETFEDTSFNESFDGRVFDKGSIGDELFESLIKACEESEDFQLKAKHSSVFKATEEKYLGREITDKLMSLIKNLENPDYLDQTEDNFNSLRKIIEAIKLKFEKLGLIPESLPLNGLPFFLKGIPKDYKILNNPFPEVMTDSMFLFKAILQDGSHYNESGVDQSVRKSGTDYLYRSLSYLMLDFVSSLPDFIDKNSNIDKNEDNWYFNNY